MAADNIKNNQYIQNCRQKEVIRTNKTEKKESPQLYKMRGLLNKNFSNKDICCKLKYLGAQSRI